MPPKHLFNSAPPLCNLICKLQFQNFLTMQAWNIHILLDKCLGCYQIVSLHNQLQNVLLRSVFNSKHSLIWCWVTESNAHGHMALGCKESDLVFLNGVFPFFFFFLGVVGLVCCVIRSCSKSSAPALSAAALATSISWQAFICSPVSWKSASQWTSFSIGNSKIEIMQL